MIRQIDTDMVLYYTLSKKRPYFLGKISELHNKLLAEFGGVIVGTSLHSIQEFEEEFNKIKAILMEWD